MTKYQHQKYKLKSIKYGNQKHIRCVHLRMPDPMLIDLRKIADDLKVTTPTLVKMILERVLLSDELPQLEMILSAELANQKKLYR